MNSPLVAIIIANFNYSKFIDSCIESAISQDYKNIKIVVVDDASTDDSVERIKKWAKIDSRIVPIYRKIGGGASIARNDAILAVWNETDYFMILDADDIAYPNKVSEMLKKITMSPMIGCVYADYHIENTETGNILAEYKEPYNVDRLQECCIVHSASMISKQALEFIKLTNKDGNIEFYSPELHGSALNEYCGACEDYLAWLLISKRYVFVHIPKPLSLVRVHKNNASQIDKVNKVWSKNLKFMQDKIANFVSNKS